MADTTHTIVLTGATGNLGSKLRRHWTERYRLCCIDNNTRGDESIVIADLASQESSWTSSFAGADVVVHLAANPCPIQSWQDAQRNIQITLNVLEAARQNGVRRVVYASSNHVMGGYKNEDDPWMLTTDMPPRPGTTWHYEGQPASSLYYALGKLCSEELGRCFAANYGVLFISVRIGWVQLGENRPEDMPLDTDEWTRLMWLSNTDLNHLFDCCLTAPCDPRFLAVNGMSANQGMRWDISAALESVNYRPQDGLA